MRHAMTMIAAAAALVPQAAAADTVSDWWEFAGRIHNAAAPGAGTPRPPEQERAVTRAALAMFEALNAIDRRYESFLSYPAGDAAASREAAAATAAFRVLLHHYPTQRATLEESHAMAMAGISDERARAAGQAIGEAAAQAAIAAGGIDPAIEQAPYRPRTAPGEWISTPLPVIEPYMLAFRPWVIPSADALSPPPPPPLSSAVWARDYEEVRRLGARNSTERTPYQTLIARYRQGYDLTPMMRAVADAPGRPPVRNARMFALYQLAFDDAVLAMAVAKFRYNYWRPGTAIRNGDADGNDSTQGDPGWVALLPTPNFPEYPCGHCTVVAAQAAVMAAETGPRPAGGVRVSSQTVPIAAVQTVPSWDQLVSEVSDSRMLGGVHFRFSNDAGEEIGRRAARMVLERTMRPLAPGPRRRTRR